MSRTIKIQKDPNDCGKLYSKSEVTFEPGITVLVGCNGSGKTTLIWEIKHALRDDIYEGNVEYLDFDNLRHGGGVSRQSALDRGDMSFLQAALLSSEGENILMNIGNQAHGLRARMLKHPEVNEWWLFLDAIDSGLSIDGVVEVKDFLKNILLPDFKDKTLYIIIAANSFELCRNERCLDIWTCKNRTFKTYDAYRNFVLRSRARKEKRYEREDKKCRKPDD